MMDDWDNLINEPEEKNDWDGEWICQACEAGPWPEEMKKCDRCGEKKDNAEDEYDADGYPIEKNEPEEIY
jgi:uncharacterized paraquat-inducible protein A